MTRHFRYEAEIVRGDHLLSDVICERVYGAVRVTAEWPEMLAAPVMRLPLEVSGELDPRDAPAYAELFFHDVFLLLNLASPGSFGGTVSIHGGDLRARQLVFDPRWFMYAAPLKTVPLAQVVRWYDGLELGTRQLATGDAAVALVQLLHLARAPEQEEESIRRLAIAADAVVERARLPVRLFELRDEIARGHTPVLHPMADDALDPRVEDITREWIETADAAARLVILALQERAGSA